MPRAVVVLGSTGSIGTQALDVVARNPADLTVVGLAAGGGRVADLLEQCRAFRPAAVAVADPAAAALLSRELRDAGTVVLTGPDAPTRLAAWDCDVVLNGMAGAAGLEPTLAALAAGRTLALANKESLIIGGPLVTRSAAPGQIVPVDSEHSALAQCLLAGAHREVRRLILTASGGPFRGWSAADLASVTPAQALAHPTWSMGPLVTVNSATLMNKGLEVIEAHLLFDLPFEAIDVVVHPQSVVHSMVEFIDGSTMAQASPPDMRLPIALGLTWPHRLANVAPGCDWRSAAQWDFLPLDEEAFGAVRLARVAGGAGGTAPAVLNAADEACVAAFLDGRISFPAITQIVGDVLAEHLSGGDGQPGSAFVSGNAMDVAGVQAADAWARRRADDRCGGATMGHGEVT